MANGKPDDHPVSDILHYGLPVYSDVVDDLVRELAKYVPRERLWEMYPWFSPPPLPEFEAQLRAKIDELRAEAKRNGWEVQD